MKNRWLIALIALTCCSCSSTSLMSLSVMEPAPVTLPPNIKTVGIIDRSKASDENRLIDNMHKAVSLETTALVTEGAKASVSGLADELMKNNRFTAVKPLGNLDLRTFGAGVLPSSLAWDSVEKICRESHTDALFSLEFFDTESKMRVAASSTSLNMGVANIPALQQQMNMETLVKTGWRIYDPSTRTILDEHMITKEIQISERSLNPLAAASALAGRKEAIKQVGNQSGQAYACRVVPYWLRVSRYYYVGGNGDFKVAMRMAQTGNWDGAAKIWQQQSNNPNGKLAGRGCYNMAIICEINGDLDGALQWAQKAYENYNVPLALSYVNILHNRKANDAELKSQNAVSSTP
jgi:hypothetical protein